jgi:uncharacterized protein (DUF1810 family)
VSDPYNLQRFIDAQESVIETALGELRAGSKRTHWMWFVFPQIAGLGSSSISQYYAIQSLEEARAYLAHPLLGPRLRQAVEAVLPWAGTRSPVAILDPVDAVKLRSSLTLFEQVEPDSVFLHALTSLFNGEADERTLALLNATR